MGIVTKIRFEELGLYFIALPSSSSRTAVGLWRQSAILVSPFVTPCDLNFDSEQRSLLSVSSWQRSQFS